MAQDAADRPKRPLRARLARGLAFRLLILAAALAVVRLTHIAESLTFYFPTREPFATPDVYSDVAIPTPDGATLHAWFIPARDAAPGEVRPAILHAHGNAGNILGHEVFSAFLVNRGFHVLLFDYRGYGRSSSAPFLRRSLLAIDTEAALDALLQRPDVDRANIGIYAVSLGAAPALDVAARRPEIKAAALVSPFSTWRAVAADHVPLLGPLLIARGMDPVNLAPRLAHRPLLLVHGVNDSIILPRHSDLIESAARAAGVRVTKALIPDADHNAIIADHPDAQDAIEAFFRSTLMP
ncbi:MAG: alpha/beta fold hydrolase [Phycisphaerae bacterium]|nr:alpha/beta fold hydrolase [Phycisphaerae bacterium]